MEKVKLTDDQVNILDLSGLSSQSLDEVMRRAKVQKEISVRAEEKNAKRNIDKGKGNIGLARFADSVVRQYGNDNHNSSIF